MDTFLCDLPGGHKLYGDRWQWIIYHPRWECTQAKQRNNEFRGPFYHTYLTAPESVYWDLGLCGVKMGVAIPPKPSGAQHKRPRRTEVAEALPPK